MITDISQLDFNQAYSYADYLQWQLDERLELIRGKIFRMSPAPNRRHQEISMNLTEVLLKSSARKQDCKFYAAPFDVRLYDSQKSRTQNEEIYTVVQPDFSIVCDKEKLDDRGCLGAPDLVVEILSPTNSKKEMKTKFNLYEESGVKEYWVVFPIEEIVQQFVLIDEGKYNLHQIATTEDEITLAVLPQITISTEQLFIE